MPAQVVYAGFSLGALPAQKLAQTRAGALGAHLFTDERLADYDDAAAELVLRRTLDFLGRWL